MVAALPMLTSAYGTDGWTAAPKQDSTPRTAHALSPNQPSAPEASGWPVSRGMR